MLDSHLQQIIEQVHAAPHRLVLEFAGAGSLALWWLHSVAGSSRTILEATDRYSPAALADMLGGPPAQAVAVPTALAMAGHAYQRARALGGGMLVQEQTDQAVPLLGVACTAAIATDYQKRGEHRCVVAVRQAAGSHTYTLQLGKGLRDRAGEEAMVSRLLLHALARACALDAAVSLELAAQERLHEAYHPAADPLALLLNEQARSVTVSPEGEMTTDAPPREVAILSGAFNPLHEGHTRMAQAAAAMLQREVLFELPIINADKGTLPAHEIGRRLRQFAGQYRVVLSREPLFVAKAALFPGSVFVVGFDTAIRLINPRYYGGEAGMLQAMAAIREAGCRFLVAGRLQDGSFRTLDELHLPASLHDLFLELPESYFRVDISSTELRQRERS
jgi:hypothetical protein